VKGSPRHLIGPWQGADDDVTPRGNELEDVAAHRAQSTPHDIPRYRIADGLGDDEPESGRITRGLLEHVQDGSRPADATALPHDGAEISRPGHAVGPGEQ